MKKIIAIDFGSTNFKAALFTADLQRLTEASISTPYQQFTHQRVELDPEEVLTATNQLLADITDTANLDPEEIDALAFSSQAQTFTLIDRETGQAKTPFYSWLDLRAEAENQEIQAAISADFHHHCTFPSAVPQMQLPKLLWVRRHLPKSLMPGAEVATLPGFIARRLAGINAIDRNLAAMHGIFSLQRNTWWAEALAAAQLTPDLFPPLLNVGGMMQGKRQPDAPNILAAAPRLVFGGNDQTAGAWGSSGNSARILCTLGTALVAYRRAGTTPGPYSQTGCWGPYPDGGFYELAVRDRGCLALDIAREFLFPKAGIDHFLTQAQQAWEQLKLGKNPTQFFPDRRDIQHAWDGTGSKSEQALAVLEGIAFSLRRLVFEELGSNQKTIGEFEIIGGGSRSTLWLQIIADILNGTIYRGTGDALLGVARLASPSSPSPPTSRSAAKAIATPKNPAPYQIAYSAWKKHS